MQVGNPFLEKLLMEACLELARLDAVVAMQDLGAAGLTCALAEVSARGGVGAEVDLDRVPRRESGMEPYEVLLSESQERMLIVVRAGRESEVEAVFARYDLHAERIGTVIDEPVVRCRAAGEVVCEIPGLALADEAPRYVLPQAPPPGLEALRAIDLGARAAEWPSIRDLLALLAGPNSRSRKPIWRRYDHMNGTNTLVAPGAGDAALLRVKGTARAIALAMDGPSPARLGALDPRLAAISAVCEAAVNVACCGARPIGLTNCLNLGSPEPAEGYWRLAEVVGGIADACAALDIPVVSGNVSLFNETADGPILPTPVIGMVGLLDDRSTARPMAWRDGDDLWLLGALGDDASSLAGSEWATTHGHRGGRPSLDAAAVGRVVELLIAAVGLVRGAHDASVGGVAAALGRMAIASGCGATVELPTSVAAWFGERAGRVIASVAPGDAGALAELAGHHGVAIRRLGTAGGGSVRIGEAAAASLDELRGAWETAF